MPLFEVFIDLGSKSFVVDAVDSKEASLKAVCLFEDLPDADKLDEYWVGDVYPHGVDKDEI